MLSPLYGQLSPLRVPSKSGRAPVSDSDAEAYLLAIEAADLQPIEDGVANAINSFVIGCKADGIWSSIKSSCILAGARTLPGALVPLVGTAPTPVSFVSADYNRTTGLLGNGTTKYLNSNRNNNADPQNNFHSSVYLNLIGIDGRAYIGVGGNNTTGTTHLFANAGSFASRNRTSSILTGGLASTGFLGHARSAINAIKLRHNSTEYTASFNSAAPFSSDSFVFARGVSTTPQLLASGRISFYSIGESLDLAALDSRVSTLMTALVAAIP
jgi:hypothetical protein